jgi:hypothetical protein
MSGLYAATPVIGLCWQPITRDSSRVNPKEPCALRHSTMEMVCRDKRGSKPP